MDHLEFIMRLEGDDDTLTLNEIIDGVAAMVEDGIIWHFNGIIWQLQGSYGRMAVGMIHAGYIDEEGNVLRYPGADE